MSESKERYQRNRVARMATMRRYYRNNKALWLFRSAKKRAEQFGLDFTITVEDVVVPEVCPVLGIPLTIGIGKPHDGSPSLDRLDSKKGYVKGNVFVISWRANRVKYDATIDELRAVIRYMEERWTK